MNRKHSQSSGLYAGKVFFEVSGHSHVIKLNTLVAYVVLVLLLLLQRSVLTILEYVCDGYLWSDLQGAGK